jgi:acyl-CoA dehydrogenase
MPDFLDDRQRELRDRADALARRLSALDRDALTGAELAAEVRALSKRAGIFTMTQPVDHGGTGAGALELAIVRDELSARDVGRLPGLFGPGPGLLAQADGPLRTAFLEPLLAGELAAGFGFTEPADAARHTWAVIDGDELVVNGQKSYVTGGGDADFVNTLVEVEGEGPAMVVIEADRPGVTLTRRFGTLDGSHHAAFRFDDVRVPRHHVIGPPGKGLNRAMDQVTAVRMAIAADCVGRSRYVLEYLAEHLRQPHRSGDTLGSGERVRMRYGWLRIQAYAARSMLYRTARLLDAGENAVNEAMATKAFATETVGATVDEGIQLVGGQALSDDHLLARLYREVRALRLAEGPTDVLSANVARGRLDMELGRL